AYDHNIPPIPYDPILGKILMELSKQQLSVMAERRREPPPDKLPEIAIGHIAEEHARNASKVIKKQLELLRLTVKLIEFPIGQATDIKGECDLVLTELSMWEPMVDARRLMGDNGLVPANNDYINLALQELDVANTWSSASSRLRDLHRISNNEMIVIPLYQTLNSFIAHKRVRGIGKSPALLYQDIMEWRIVDEVEE
ncbi:MAG: ABC-type oligopeptide transport system substrate-binding subunit, partial [Pirellulaceae bacterium]